MTEIPRVSDTDLQAIINVHNSGKLTKDKQNHAVQYILPVARDLKDARKTNKDDNEEVRCILSTYEQTVQKFTAENRELSTQLTALREAVEKDSAQLAYDAGLGVSEWEAFLNPETRKALLNDEPKG